ncbi:MAG: efflux RND transporter periplasmic adaptor subunit, partial [Acidobacteria bacterium]|nr:efflux RND transporter periplasmic adaptor subunit [Acidobacteriota bacterium]
MKGGMETAHWAAAAAVVLALVAGCGGRQDTRAASAETGRPAAAAVPIVEVAAARSEPIQATFDAPGTFIPADEATIAAEVAGVVRVVRVEEDSRVRKGEVLAELDRVKAQLAVKQAEAALAQARANFEKAKSELERKKLLLEDRTIAPGTFETFKAQHDAAAAASDGAETALQLARQRLRDLTVTAPFAGVVKEKKVSPGEYVREGQELLVLMRVDPVKLQFDLPEKYAPRIKEGQQVVATVSAEPGREHTGRIRTVFPAVAVETRSVRAEAIVPNPGYRLKPGFYASVRVPL